MKKLAIILLVLVGCSKDDDPAPVKLAPDYVYKDHVNTFYIEAAARGKNPPKITPEVRFTKNATFNIGCASAGQYFTQYKQSTSYKSGEKYIIELDDRWSSEQNGMKFDVMIWREMAHLTMDKSYTENAQAGINGYACTDIMCQCAVLTGADTKLSLDYLFR